MVELGGGAADVAGKDRREVLANWLASPDNPYFARNLANIDWAHFFGKGIIERDMENTIPDLNAEIVLYCGGGYRSALAADALQRMGYTRVISMDGGYRGWVEAGLPVEKK